MANMHRTDIDMSDLSEDEKAKHIERIAQRFANFRGNLDWLAEKMYVDHFTEDPKKSPEYVAIVDATANWERNVLEKYRA